MATTDEVTLSKGAVAPVQKDQTASQKAVTLIQDLATKPSLPTAGTIKPTLVNVDPTTELMTTQGIQAPITAQTATAPTPTAIQGSTVPGAAQTTAPTTQTAGTQTANLIGTAQQATAAQQTALTQAAQAAQGTITADATVKGQLQSLQNEVTTAIQSGNPLPVWARGAAKATEAAMNRRGMSASSMAAEALAEGIMNAAVPIAAQDASTYKDMIFQNLANNQQANIVNAQSYLRLDTTNLSNLQQTSLANLNARQSVLFSDQSAQNAAAQFNATSQNQVNQFYDNLSTQVEQQNNARTDAMNQYRVSELNKIEALNTQNEIAVNEANAAREATINQFNANLESQRQQFNVNNQREIDQSNVVWRRSTNTANTAAINAANQANAQNLLNLNNWALSSLWQQWRDEASWVNTASENDANRKHNLAMAALERSNAIDLQNKKSKDALYQMIGTFGFDLLTG
jgi:hypothetical protein